MKFPRRVYGIENEFAVMMRYNNRRWGPVAEFYVAQLHKEPRVYMAAPLFDIQKRRWHTNGGCSYIDCDHPEYASPECASVFDAVLYAKAGEFMMNEVYSRPSSSGVYMALFKNNLGYTNAADGIVSSYGCHENYYRYSLDVKEGHVRSKFNPFLVTRQIFDGAGWWQNGSFFRSQRSLCISSEYSINTLSDKSIINYRDTSLDTGLRRLHLTLGDANILDVACFLKIGTASIVISLIEGGRAPEVKVAEKKSVSTLRDIAQEDDITLPHPAITYRGARISPLETQVLYYTAARNEFTTGSFDSEEIRNDLGAVLDLWEQTLNALYHHDTAWLVGRIDYLTKKYLADLAIARRQISDAADICAIQKIVDLSYHNVTDRTLQNRMNALWPERRLLTDKQIEKACFFPPRGITRARMRGLFIASTLDIADHIDMKIDWKCCEDKDLPLGKNKQELDVFEDYSSGFADFLIASLCLPHTKEFVRSL